MPLYVEAGGGHVLVVDSARTEQLERTKEFRESSVQDCLAKKYSYVSSVLVDFL